MLHAVRHVQRSVLTTTGNRIFNQGLKRSYFLGSTTCSSTPSSNHTNKCWRHQSLSSDRGQHSWSGSHQSAQSKWLWPVLGSSAIIAASFYTAWKRQHMQTVYAAENSPDISSTHKEEPAVPTEKPAPTENVTTEQSSETPGGETSKEDQTPEETPEPKPPSFPEHVNYLIIGGGTAAYHACTAIRVKDTKGKVLIVTEEDFGPYSRPPLSKNLWYTENREKARNLAYSDGDDFVPIFYQRQSIYVEPEDLEVCENGAVALATKKKVVKLDVWRKKAFLDDGKEIKYDKCLIATGGKPKNLSVIENAGEDVAKRTLLFRGINDFWKLDRIADTAKSVTVIGGGFLGSELACALAYRGKESKLKVYQTFPESGNLAKVLPGSLSKWATSEMSDMGVNVKAQDEVTGVSYHDDQVEVTLKSGEKLLSDYILVAVGIEANTQLAETSGLEVDKEHGGFRVNTELQARSNIWVAGDASCFYDTILGRRRVEHYEHAEITGHIAGENMTGGNMPYWIQSSFWSDLFPFLNLEAVGLVDSSLPTVTVLIGEEVQKRQDISDGDITTQTLKEDFHKGGVVFYMQGERIVGVLMWNLPGRSRVPLARKLLRDGGVGKDIGEVARMFDPLAKGTYKKKSKESAERKEEKLAETSTEQKPLESKTDQEKSGKKPKENA